MPVVEQNSDLLMRNHEIRPTSFNPFPEVNAIKFANVENKSGRGRVYRQYRSRGHGRSKMLIMIRIQTATRSGKV